jgi:hypothetical protein
MRTVFLFLLAATFMGSPARGAEIRTSEYELKAAFIFNFSQFVEWPTNAFESESDPIIITLLGPDPFGALLDKLVEGEEVRGRKLKVERVGRLADLRRTHILYVPKSMAAQWPEILAAIQGKAILTVSDMDRFTSRGGMIQLVTERNLVRMRVNAEAARGADLVISSKLLRLADNVTRDGGVAP